jgi:hypothetical protein
MHVAGLWRYPVKSLGGEAVSSAALTSDGVPGDRLVHVRDGRGVLTGRTRHGLLTLPGGTGPDGAPTVAGHRWNSPPALAAFRERAGQDAELATHEGPERFDVTNLLVATDGAVERFGHDLRRIRPNLLIDGVPAEAEATWPGQALIIGDAVIGVHSVRHRCIVTSIDPDTGAQELDVFRWIGSGTSSVASSHSTAGSSAPAPSTWATPRLCAPRTRHRRTLAAGSWAPPTSSRSPASKPRPEPVELVADRSACDDLRASASAAPGDPGCPGTDRLADKIVSPDTKPVAVRHSTVGTARLAATGHPRR